MLTDIRVVHSVCNVILKGARKTKYESICRRLYLAISFRDVQNEKFLKRLKRLLTNASE